MGGIRDPRYRRPTRTDERRQFLVRVTGFLFVAAAIAAIGSFMVDAKIWPFDGQPASTSISSDRLLSGNPTASPAASASVAPAPTTTAAPTQTPRITAPPTATPPASYVTVGGDATYPVTSKTATFMNTTPPTLNVTLSVSIAGDECQVLVALPADAAERTYNVDEFLVAVLVGCTGFASDDGTVTVTKRSAESISGTFAVSQREDGQTYSGTFEDVDLQ
jgi:hypothetical protein